MVVQETSTNLLSGPSDSVIEIGNDSDLASQGWPGLGTESDPYLIQDLELIESWNLITISNTRKHIVIRNCYLPYEGAYGYSIKLTNVSNCIIENCTIGKDIGMEIYSSTNCHIRDNTFYVDIRGVFASFSSDSTLTDNIFVGMTFRSSHSAAISGCYNWSVTGNTVHDTVGFSCGSDSMRVINNTFQNIQDCGLRIGGVDNVAEGNLFQSIEGYGLCIEYSEYGTFINNIFEKNGVYILGRNLVEWTHNFTGNMINGKAIGYLEGATNATVDLSIYNQIIAVNCHNMTLNNGHIEYTLLPMMLYGCTNVSVVDSLFDNNKIGGLLVQSCSNISISNCALSNNSDYCIKGSSVTDFTILSNTMHGPTSCGVSLLNCIANITDNTISDTGSDGGIYIRYSTADLIGNEFYNSGVVIDYYTDASAAMIGNTVNGKDILMLKNVEDESFDASLYGQLFIVDCRNISVENADFSNTSVGVHMHNTSGCAIENMNMPNTLSAGMMITCSEDVQIVNCVISNGKFGILNLHSLRFLISQCTINRCEMGIFAMNCSYFLIEQCTLLGDNNQWRDDWHWGIRGESDLNHSVIRECTISGISGTGITSSGGYNISIEFNNISRNNREGISLWGFDTHSRIIGNQIYDNGYHGIMIYSDKNTIFSNEIGWNEYANAVDYGEDNVWDDGISQGNYWSHIHHELEEYQIPGQYTSLDHYPTTLLYIEPLTPIGSEDTAPKWNVHSYYETQYTAYRNGTEIESGETDGYVELSLGSIAPGIYNFTIVVTDELNHAMSAFTYVTVTDDFTPTSSTTPTTSTTAGQNPPSMTLIVVLGGASICIVAAVVLFGKRR